MRGCEAPVTAKGVASVRLGPSLPSLPESTVLSGSPGSTVLDTSAKVAGASLLQGQGVVRPRIRVYSLNSKQIKTTLTKQNNKTE